MTTAKASDAATGILRCVASNDPTWHPIVKPIAKLGAALLVLMPVSCLCNSKTGPATSTGASADTQSLKTDVDFMQTPTWPSDPNAAWPNGCLIENVAVHPSESLLAAACTHIDRGDGAVVLIDLETARLRSVFPYPEFVGWPGRELLHWHPSGERLVTNVGTNAIGIVEPEGFIATALPDDGRDHGVRSVWVGDELFTDTGSLIDVKPLDQWLPERPRGAPWMYPMTWNDELESVVGRAKDAVVVFDPVAKKVVHRKPAGERGNGPSFSRDGAWFVEQKTLSPKPIEIAVFEVRPPWRAWIVAPTGMNVRADPAWGPDGRLVIYNTDYELDFERRKLLDTPYIRPRFDFVERGEIVRTVPLK